MIKRYVAIIVCCFCLLCSGCIVSKDDLTSNVNFLQKENDELKQEYDKFKNVSVLYDFYNQLTLETVHSLVLVESKNIGTLNTQYSEGVVVYSNGYNFYILTDYSKLLHSYGVKYRVMDASANVYDAALIYDGNNIMYDVQTGMVLLRVQLSRNTANMKEISLGNRSDTMAVMSNLGQLNKIQLINNNYINSEEYIDYDEEIYKSFCINQINYGSIINDNGDLAGLYLNNLQAFADASLIKKVAYATYSLVL